MTWLPADRAIAATEDWDYVPDLEEMIDPTPPKKLPFPEWHIKSACAALEPVEAERIFFGARDTEQRPTLSLNDIAIAKGICAQCPVYATCLRTALGARGENREEYGIWAGTSGRTRKRIWALVDEDGVSLPEIIADILAGNLAAYERSTPAVPAQVIPFPGRESVEEAA